MPIRYFMFMIAGLANVSPGPALAGGAFDTSPWDSAPFGQASGPSAAVAARVAGALADAQAVNAKPIVVGNTSVTVRSSGCQVNVGGVSGGGNTTINNTTIAATTVVNAPIITICN